jgi:hypothetical protein
VFGGQFLFGVPMNEHLRYLRKFLQHGILNQMGNALSSRAESSPLVNDDVQVNAETEAHAKLLLKCAESHKEWRKVRNQETKGRWS